MKKLILMLCVCFSLAIVSCKETAKEPEAEAETEMQVENAADQADMAMAAEYQCPMDCEEGKTYDKEGACPVCKMDLKKKEGESATDDSESTEEGHDSH
ncbi:MAG: heavy metal-binding domain-containing protein [Flavobacteriaceae bacterium]